MAVSSVQSGYQIIQQSKQMAEEAALQLNRAERQSPSEDLSFNRVEFEQKQDDKPTSPPPSDPTDALIKLNQASGYNRIGASVVERNNDVIGTLLDIQV